MPSPPSSLQFLSAASGRIGPRLSLAASLIWPAQAALIALMLADLLAGRAALSPVLAALGFFVLAILRAMIDAAAQKQLSDRADSVLAKLREEVLQTEAEAAAPSQMGGAGALAALAAEKLEAARPYIMRYQPARMRAAVMPLLILGFAAWHSWAVALVLIMAGPLIPLFMALVGWAAKEASARQMVEIGQLSDLLVDRLAALSDLRLIGAGGPVVAGFAKTSDDLRQRTMAVLRIAFLSSTVLELFAALGVAMVAVWVGFALLGAIEWGTWGTPLSPFAGIFLLLLVPEFFQPLRDLSAAWHDKAAAEAVAAELDTWRADTRPRLFGAGGQGGAMAKPHSIRLQGAMLQRAGRPLFFPDFEISAGQSIAITGPSGVGKTTLLRLLAGLEQPERGGVFLDDTLLSDDNADSWRARVGWMPQAPHFLNRSLRYNIGFGAPLQPELLSQARLEGVIAALPKQELTPLGERGAGLSGGEARRVMLARALHAGGDVLLADEPTADLDSATADAVIAGLMGFAKAGSTLIVATHDQRVMARMDHVLTLEPAPEAQP